MLTGVTEADGARNYSLRAIWYALGQSWRLMLTMDRCILHACILLPPACEHHGLEEAAADTSCLVPAVAALSLLSIS